MQPSVKTIMASQTNVNLLRNAGMSEKGANAIFIGRKPVMNYILAVVATLNQGSIIVKARGLSISKVVDGANI